LRTILPNCRRVGAACTGAVAVPEPEPNPADGGLLVTGAGGYTGLALARSLARCGHPVRGHRAQIARKPELRSSPAMSVTGPQRGRRSPGSIRSTIWPPSSGVRGSRTRSIAWYTSRRHGSWWSVVRWPGSADSCIAASSGFTGMWRRRSCSGGRSFPSRRPLLAHEARRRADRAAARVTTSFETVQRDRTKACHAAGCPVSALADGVCG